MISRTLSVVAMIALMASSAGAAKIENTSPGNPVADLEGGACPEDIGRSPFTGDDTTRIVVADFWDARPTDDYDPASVSDHIDRELRRFRDEDLDQLPGENDLSAALEIERLRC